MRASDPEGSQLRRLEKFHAAADVAATAEEYLARVAATERIGHDLMDRCSNWEVGAENATGSGKGLKGASISY